MAWAENHSSTTRNSPPRQIVLRVNRRAPSPPLFTQNSVIASARFGLSLGTRVAATASEDGEWAHDLILLGWRFRRRARCGHSAAMAMVLRRRAHRRARGRQPIPACRGQIDTDGRVVPSTTRAAILISRRRIVANSAVDSGGALGSGVAHCKQEPIGGGVQNQAELVGFGIVQGGGGRKRAGSCAP